MNSPPFHSHPTNHDAGAAKAGRTCLLVLGMHRSGTSALTRVLSIAGAKLPATLMGPSKGNDTGHWESDALAAYHDRVLAELGSSWRDWRAFDVRLLPVSRRRDIKTEIADLVAVEFGEAPIFVVKDPRICRFTSLFLDALDEAAIATRVVLAIRNPLEVVRSLSRRDDTTQTEAILLWLRHVLDSEAASRSRRRVIVSYSALLDDWQSTLARITKGLDISWLYSADEISSQIEQFLDGKHRHHRTTNEDALLEPTLRGWVADTYSAMLVLEQNPGSETALATLDSVRREFQQASPILDRLQAEIRAAHKLSEEHDAQRFILDQVVRESCEVQAQLSAELEARTSEASSLNDQLDGLSQERSQLHAQLREARDEISRLEQELEDRKLKQAVADAALREAAKIQAQLGVSHARQEAELSEIRSILDNSNIYTADLTTAVQARETRLARIEKEYAALLQRQDQSRRDLINHFRNSTSWRVTAPLRFLKSLLASEADIPDLAAPTVTLPTTEGIEPPEVGTFLITTLPHTMFVAEMIRDVLDAAGYKPTISLDTNNWERFERRIVLCPQWFTPLPDDYIAFQMEQSIANHWFTPNYFATLKQASIILDYASQNIPHLLANGIDPKKLYFTPLSFNKRQIEQLPQREASPHTDQYVLFFGEENCARRRTLLAALRQHFNVKVLTNTFGEKLEAEIRGAACVINIHFYENALLETTRIYQVLSLATPIVSETSFDVNEHAALHELVDFVPVGDVDAMIASVRRLLDDQAYREGKVARIIQSIREQPNKFEYYLFRFLLGEQLVSLDRVLALTPAFVPTVGDNPLICLTLPETPERTAAFRKQNLAEFNLWHGLRGSPGWVGCAMSYKALFEALRDSHVGMATICEDDVLVDEDFHRRFEIVQRYLRQHDGQWDVFSGFIADVHTDAEIIAMEEFEGITFVHMNRTVSMVFNIYSPGTIAYLADWDPITACLETNTIDRYLERREPNRVVTTFPFLVSHRPDVDSTLWDCSNADYVSLIKKSTTLLAEKIEAFRKGQPTGTLGRLPAHDNSSKIAKQ